MTPVTGASKAPSNKAFAPILRAAPFFPRFFGSCRGNRAAGREMPLFKFEQARPAPGRIAPLFMPRYSRRVEYFQYAAGATLIAPAKKAAFSGRLFCARAPARQRRPAKDHIPPAGAVRCPGADFRRPGAAAAGGPHRRPARFRNLPLRLPHAAGRPKHARRAALSTCCRQGYHAKNRKLGRARRSCA